MTNDVVERIERQEAGHFDNTTPRDFSKKSRGVCGRVFGTKGKHRRKLVTTPAAQSPTMGGSIDHRRTPRLPGQRQAGCTRGALGFPWTDLPSPQQRSCATPFLLPVEISR